jgi:hypothetical protein
MLGLAYLGMGHLPESLDHYREALRLLGYPMPATNTRIIASLIKELLVQVFHRLGVYGWRKKKGTMDERREA